MVWAVKPGRCYSSWLNFIWHNKKWQQIRLLNGFNYLRQRLTIQFPHPLFPLSILHLIKLKTHLPQSNSSPSSFKHVYPQRMIPYASDSFTINSSKCYFDVQEALLRLSHESFFLETGNDVLPKAKLKTHWKSLSWVWNTGTSMSEQMPNLDKNRASS